jgi:hypothetical protein
MPTGKSYERALRNAEAELAREKRRREEKDQRIAQLEQIVSGLRALVTPGVQASLGLTDAVRQVLQAASQPMRASDVRAELNALGKSLDDHRNPMASLHSILSRLIKHNDLMELSHEGTKYYWWRANGAAPTPFAGTDDWKERKPH